jgi:hypothetical protein
MKRKLVPYQEHLLESLQDPELAQLYLNEAANDEDPRILLLALKNIEDARNACPHPHIPNEVTQKALEELKSRMGWQKAATVEELFKQLIAE